MANAKEDSARPIKIMFSEIEKTYKKGLPQKRFAAYYRPRAILVVIIALMVDFGLGVNRWLVYGVTVAVLVAFVALFFLRDLRRASKKFPKLRQSRGLTNKIAAYIEFDDTLRIDNLIHDLNRHHLKTRDDIEVAIHFFETHHRLEAQTSVLEWVLTAAVAILSLVVVAYDDGTRAIDFEKLFMVLAPTFGVTLLLLTPFLLAKLISHGIDSSRTKVDSSLVEDLAYIYVNFDKYRDKLVK